jgi:alpha-L-rhamnosidase
MDRRSFLVNGLRASAAAVVASQVPDHAMSGAMASDRTRLTASAHPTETAAALTVGRLTVNGLVNPIGIDPDDCSFAWALRSPGRNARQSAYRITVRRTDPLHRGEVWDSGAVTSGRQAFVLYGGATLPANAAFTWTVQVQNEAGQWSEPAPQGSFVTALRHEDWTAQWLHPAASSGQPNRVTYVRSVWTPPVGTLVRATAFISAAHTYQFFINGELVDRGPSFSYPSEQYSRCIDLTDRVRPGASNALGVLHRWYGAGKGRPESAPGLLLQVSLLYADGRRFTTGTDGTWRELPAEWLPSPLRNTEGFDFVEWVDSRAHPMGWAGTDFDDSSWSTVAVRGPAGTAPFTGIFAQRTSTDDQVVEPVSRRMLPNGSLVFDFGAVYAARISVRFDQGLDGWTVPMHVGYLLDPDGQVSTTHGTQTTNLSFTYITRDGAQQFEALTYLGFRYLQIDNPGEAIGSDQVQAIATHAAMPEVPMATFATGQAVLDSVWTLNTRSCLYCTHEQFVDTPTREKGQFLWDAANESEAVMRAYGDQNMSWQALRDVARGQARFWPDGQVNAIYPNGDGAREYATSTARYSEWLWRYYSATGDRDTAVLLYPSAEQAADYLWTGRDADTGLLTAFEDQSNGDPVYGFDLGVSADTPSNVLSINAFQRTAQLAQLAGDEDAAAIQLARAAELTTTVNARMVRADGVYIDGLYADGTQSTSASQESNALPLAYGVVPDDRLATVGDYVASLGISVGPNHGLELLRGLAQAQLWEHIVQVLTDARVPGWAHILSVGGTFTWEEWSPSDLIGDSMSHGWGSSALVAMQESLLGLTLLPPGDDGTMQIALAPPRGGLGGARGSFPSVAGPVVLEWSRSRSTLSVQADIPANATAHFSLPAPSLDAVREGGVAVTHAPGITDQYFSGGMAALTTGSGTYQFTVAAT